MKQGISVAVASLGLLLGQSCSVALADSLSGTLPAPPVTTTTATATAKTVTATTTTALSPSPRTKRISTPQRTFPAGVRIAGVRLTGLDAASAAKAVEAAFARPLPVIVDGTRVSVEPTRLATAYVIGAVARARVAAPGENVRLVVSIHGAAVRALVSSIARRFDKTGVPSRLTLRAGQPYFSPVRTGHRLAQAHVVAGIDRALVANTRLAVGFHTQTIQPGIAAGKLGLILINRSINRLTFFDNGQVYRFPVATGQPIYPTPAGVFHIVVMWKNPWWYPPTQDAWAKGLKPVPPGPFNPLGTRWMGLSSPGIGIHGTDAPSSIGYNVSHGCIRMQVPDAEWLYNHVSVGTTVFIV